MTCKVEDCEQPVLIVKRQMCRIHYQRWRIHGHTNLVHPECEEEGCVTRVRTGRGKCSKHEKFKGTGRGGSGGHNKIEGECAFEGCDRRRTQMGYCGTHKQQYKKYGFVWPIGEPRPNRTIKSKEGRWNGYMGAAHSAERTCERCGETKQWQRFCLGTEHMKDVCRDCNRAALSRAAKGETEPPKPNKNMDALLDFLSVERI